MGEAEKLSDRIGIIAKGKLVAVGTAKELMERTEVDNFEDAFVEMAGELYLNYIICSISITIFKTILIFNIFGNNDII